MKSEVGWCNGFAASAAALRQREKERARARDSLGRFPGLISRCLRSFASSPLLFLLPTARICPRRRRAVATRKNARVRMLPAKKEEGLGRSSECWERHTAKHPAIPSECNMHIHRYITTRLVSEQVIHMFGAVLWVAKFGGRLASPNLFAVVLTNISRPPPPSPRTQRVRSPGYNKTGRRS